MVFQFFMFMSVLLIPVIMVMFGALFRKKAPGRINLVYGYRTLRSMKNVDTWNFAHHYIGKKWFAFGWILLAVTACVMTAVLVLVGEDERVIGTASTVIMLVQLIPLLGTTAATEQALKRTFDDEGRRRQ